MHIKPAAAIPHIHTGDPLQLEFAVRNYFHPRQTPKSSQFPDAGPLAV